MLVAEIQVSFVDSIRKSRTSHGGEGGPLALQKTIQLEAPCTPDAMREAKQIRMRKSYCSNRTVHTAGNKQHMKQQATKWDLAPFLCIASRVASSVHGA